MAAVAVVHAIVPAAMAIIAAIAAAMAAVPAATTAVVATAVNPMAPDLRVHHHQLVHRQTPLSFPIVLLIS
jgi:hypothetical protein